MNFLVTNSIFNQHNNKEIIGLIFEVPPSYTTVEKVDQDSDFSNYREFMLSERAKTDGELGTMPTYDC